MAHVDSPASSAEPSAPPVATAWLAELATLSGDARARFVLRLLGAAVYTEAETAVDWPSHAALVGRLMAGGYALTARLFGVAFVYLDSGEGALAVKEDGRIETTSLRVPNTERLRLVSAPRTFDHWRELAVPPKFTFVQVGAVYYTLCPAGLVAVDDMQVLIHAERKRMRAVALGETPPPERAAALAGYIVALDYWEVQDAAGKALLKMDYAKRKK